MTRHTTVWWKPVAGVEQITRLLLSPPEDASGSLEELPTKRMEHLVLGEAALLTPRRPSKIVCVGPQLREHATELGNEVPAEPLIFFKPPSSLLAPGGLVVRPKVSSGWTFEGELGVVMARQCYQLRLRRRCFVPTFSGYTCVNDMTARDLQTKTANGLAPRGLTPSVPWDR